MCIRDSVYAALDYTFKDLGYNRTFLGTVEAYPSMESLKKQLKALAPVSYTHLDVYKRQTLSSNVLRAA